MLDSGERQNYDTGAVRDTAKGKPRIDLFSYYMFTDLLQHEGYDEVLNDWARFKKFGTKDYLYTVFMTTCEKELLSITEGITRVSFWLAEGAKKYSERNWEAGIPVSRVVESADRHLVKWMDEEDDEDHFAAFLCNIMFIYHYKCLIEDGYMDECIDDYPYTDKLVKRVKAPMKTAVNNG